MEESSHRGGNAGFTVQNWAVCFLDLLGQQDAFMATDFIPDAADYASVERFRVAVSSSLGVINQFYKLCEQFGQEQEDLHPESPLRNLPDAQREAARVISRANVKNVCWSDGAVFYASLFESPACAPPVSVRQILLVVGAMMVLQLASGHAVRGGIDVGTGVETSGQLFGAGVVKAYRLESKTAQSPRIVVGPSLISYLDAASKNTGRDFRSLTSAAFARDCRDMIIQDSDDHWVLDYLGVNARDRYGGGLEASMVEQARRFVAEAREGFRAKDQKLFDRYSTLLRYFDSRMHAWRE
jgi:hypothetical protein